MEHWTAKFSDNNGLNRLFEGRRFAKFLFERKLRNAMYRSVLHIAASTNEALEVLRALSKDEIIVREEVLSIRTA